MQTEQGSFGQGHSHQEKKASDKLYIDRDIGHIELGVVDYGSLTIVSASSRFYEWVNRPRMERVSLLELIPELDIASVHQALDAFDGVCEVEGAFVSTGGPTVRLKVRLLKTGNTLASPLRLIAFDITELKHKEEILRTVSTLLESHKAIIADSRKTLKVLLDSLPQAVFLIDSSLRITPEISKKAEELFGNGIEYAALSELLRCTEDDLEPLRLAFDGVDWDMMAGVLPTEFVYDDKIFSIGFIPVQEDSKLKSVTVVVDDVTERRRMEQSLEQTDADNRALVAILASKDEFVDLVNLARKAAGFTDDPHAFRSVVHGLKGGFSFLDCDKLASMCHRAEERLIPDVYTPSIGKQLMTELNGELWSFMDRYQHVLRIDLRADAGIASRGLQLDYEAIGKLYALAESERVSPKVLAALEELVELPVHQLLGWLDKAWLKTLRGESKEGVPIIWRGNVALSREPYRELLQSFVHIIRNSADHGIELPREREKRGKSRAGSMVIDVSYQNGVYLFTFEDDGAGIDPENLIAVARARGIYLPEGITREQALMLVCEPGFSSRTQVTALSGRGIGVDAVRRAAKICGGDVKVESELGQGTKISVWFKRQRYWRSPSY
jgi:two-component system chemotaxis sensor kinase CheA